VRLRQAIWATVVAVLICAPSSGAAAGPVRVATVSSGACTSAFMRANPPSAANTVPFTATATTCANPEFRFFVQRPGGSWTAQTGYGAATWDWVTTGLPGGVYGVGAWARNIGSTAAHEAYWIGTWTLPVVPPCAAAFISTASSAPFTDGSSVQFTGGVSRCPIAKFRFWLLRPGGSWKMVRDYGSSTWTWNTKGYPDGVYQVGVWAKRPGSLKAYDVYGIKSYGLGFVRVCATTADISMPAAAIAPGDPAQFVATTPFGCRTFGANYEFWLKAPGGAWKVVQPYQQDSNIFGLNTTGWPLGTYEVGVWITTGRIPYDSYAITTFQLGVITCTAATIGTDLASPQSPGATITVSGSSSSNDCPSPDIEFWLLPSPSTGWVIVRPYGATTTFALDTTGAPPGMIQIGVWVRQPGSPNSYDTYATMSFWLGS
jgi:hypothetical protein